MKTETYKKEDITAYLLGALPEAEAEYFDELSFTDDNFADELKSVEKDLVDAYVNGELSGAELEQFKSYYLASPIRREKVEFAQAFQSFAEKELAKESVETVQNKKAGFFSGIFTIPRLSLQWGFALATLALIFFGGWMFWENLRLRNEIGQTEFNRDELLKREADLKQREKQLKEEIANQQIKNSENEKELAQIQAERAKLEEELRKQKLTNQPKILEPQPKKEELAKTKQQATTSRQINIATFILTPLLRGNNQPQTVTIPQKTDFASARLELEATDFTSYRVVLTDSAGKNLWRSGKLKAKGTAEKKSLNLQIPAKLLKSDIYVFTVSGISADGTAENIGNYSFRIVLQ